MTSKLERYLSKELYTRFGQYSIRQNYRPDWMEGLELDFYIDELKLAAEVQGQQHYGFVEYFHRTADGFDAQKQRDQKKKLICRENKITLFEIFTEKDADLFIQEVKFLTIKNTPKYFYQEPEVEHLTSRQKMKVQVAERTRLRKEKSALRKAYKKEHDENRHN